MPEKMTESAMDSMFNDIGKAKENMARGIMEQQQKEAEEARRHSPFGGNKLLYDDDVDLDAMEKQIEEELRLARLGVPVGAVQPAEEEAPSVEEEKPAEEQLVESGYVLDMTESETEPELVEPEPEELDLPEVSFDLSEPKPEPEPIPAPVPMAAPLVMVPAKHETIAEEVTTEAEESAVQEETPETVDAAQVVEADKEEEPIESDFVLDLTGKAEAEVVELVIEDIPEVTSAETTAEEPVEESVEQPAEPAEPEIVNKAPVAETESEEPIAEEAAAETVSEVIEEAVPEKLEVDEVLQPDIAKAKLFVGKEDSGKYQYMVTVTTSKGNRTMIAETVDADNLEEAAFIAAGKFLDRAEKLNDQTIILYAPESIADMLRRNAAYGIVDGYSDACVAYVEKVRALAGKKSLRVVAGETDESDIWQHIDAAF